MRIRGLGILTAVVMIAGIWYLYKISYSQALTHAILITHCDNHINPKIQQQIKDWCTQNCSLINSQQWIQKFKEAFPIIDHIISKKETSNSLIVSIKSKKIKAQLNNDYIVDNDGTIFPISFFDQHEFTLPHITTQQTVQHDPHFKIFMKNIPLYILERYTIDWHEPHKIYLKPKKGAAIITRHNLIPSSSLLKHGTKLCSQRPAKRGVKCVIDLRFNDQIVIYDTRGR